ncbi:hypothetical protein RYX36_005331 [Vicia faba]
MSIGLLQNAKCVQSTSVSTISRSRFSVFPLCSSLNISVSAHLHHLRHDLPYHNHRLRSSLLRLIASTGLLINSKTKQRGKRRKNNVPVGVVPTTIRTQ